MRSRLLVLSSIIGACVVAAPSAAFAQRIGRVDRGRYEFDHWRYDVERRIERAHAQAAERAARAESRAEIRADSRAYESLRRSDRAFLRDDHAMRMRERADVRQAMRTRSRYRW
jgi:phage protein D